MKHFATVSQGALTGWAILLLAALAPAFVASARAQSVSVALPDTVASGDRIALPIRVGPTDGLGIVAFNMTIAYDAAVMSIDSVSGDGHLGEAFNLTTNFAMAGQAVIAGASAAPLSGSGVLLELHAEIVGNGQTVLEFVSVTFNEGLPQADATNGSLTAGGTSTDDDALPQAFRVISAYPNPFAASTTLTFTMPAAAPVTVRLYDMLGREVLRHEAEVVPAGPARAIVIDGSALPSGVYVYRLETSLPGGGEATSGVFTRIR